ncbi:hypothetical protein [Arcticibacter tournemirensis]|uniref:hypothetical protein n=1 Tax=Arcticibacter tournemirensis TaxID=699437 RepID=UPI0037423FCE
MMEFYAERNHNRIYSIKLYKNFTKSLNLLLKHPDLGIKTSEEAVRGLIVLDYILFYEIIGNDIVVHTV